MRKYIIGFIVGGALTFAIQAGAASLLGSTVDSVITVEVDGESLGQAPVIDGVSYLPVRKLGEATGYEVNFGEGKATLTNVEPVSGTPIEVPVVEPTTTLTPEGEIVTETSTITVERLNTLIAIAKLNIDFAKKNIEAAEKAGNQKEADAQRKYLSEREASLAEFEARKAALEAQP